MKKVFAVVIALTMLFSLFAITSSAASAFNIDGAFLTNDPDPNANPAYMPKGPHTPLEDDYDVRTAAAGGDLGNLYDKQYDYLHIQGWYSTDDDLADIGYQIDNGDIVWGKGIYDVNIIAANPPYPTGSAHPLRYNITVPFGKNFGNELKFYEKLDSGATSMVKSIKWNYYHPDALVAKTNIDYAALASANAIVENRGKGPDLGSVKVAVEKGAQFLYLIGWHYPSKPIDTFGYQTDDGDITFDDVAISYSQDTADYMKANFGAAYANADAYRNFASMIPLYEGEHTVSYYVRHEDGSISKIYGTRYNNDDTNIALSKPVHEELEAGESFRLGYWDPSFITDGTKFVHDTGITDGEPLGWYSTVDTLPAYLYIDLKGVYDLSCIKVFSQGFAEYTFPAEFEVYTTLDCVNWDLVDYVEGRAGAVDSADPFVFETSNRARYICIAVYSGASYVSIGEVEAFGTFVEEASGRAPYMDYYTNYDGSLINDPGFNAGWAGHGTGDLDLQFVFNTDVEFYAVEFPMFWAFKGCPVTVEFKNGDNVASLEGTFDGDGAVLMGFEPALPAGEYLVTMTITDATKTTDGNDYYVNYFAVGSAYGTYGWDYVASERGIIALRLYSDDASGNGFIPRELSSHVNTDAIGKGDTSYGAEEGLNVPTEAGDEYVRYVGWLAANYPVEKYGYKLDGGETVYSDEWKSEEGPITEAALSFFPVAGSGFRANVYVPVVDSGLHEVEIVGFAGGEEIHMVSFTYGTDTQEPKEYVDYNAGESTDSPVDGKAIWMNNAGEKASATFTTAGVFNKIRLTRFWASRPDNGVPVKVRLLLTDADGELVAAGEYEPNGDNDPEIILDLEADVDAGTYTLTVEVAGDFLTGGNDGAYLVLDHCPDSEVENIDYTTNAKNRGNGTFAFVVTGEKVDGDFFLPNQADNPPVDNPGTGSAMTAVFASVVALAFVAAFVLKKKRCF